MNFIVWTNIKNFGSTSREIEAETSEEAITIRKNQLRSHWVLLSIYARSAEEHKKKLNETILNQDKE